jgi:hypothetical protein
MKRMHRPVSWMIAGVAAATALVMPGASAPAQDTATSGSAASRAPKPPPRTQATPQMIEEAIQRSKARTEKLRATGRPEQWGSEEPFTFDPSR